MIKISKSIFFLILIGITHGQDTLTIMSYNALRFSENNASRAQYFEKVINYIKPDIVAFQEIEDQGGIDLLLNEVFNKNSQEYSSGPLSNSRDMENGVIYRSTLLDLVSNKSISTDLRDISGFRFSIKNDTDSEERKLLELSPSLSPTKSKLSSKRLSQFLTIS